MRKKLSLLLVLCMLAGLVTPAAEVRAAGISNGDVQAVETAVEEPDSEEYGNAKGEESASEEDISKEELSGEEAPAEELPGEEVPEEEPEATDEIVEEITEEAEVSAEEQAAELTTDFDEYGADNWAVAVTDSYSYGVELLMAYDGNGIPGMSGILITESAAGVDLTEYADGITSYSTPADVENSILVDTVTVKGTEREVPVRYLDIASSTTAYSLNNKGSGSEYVRVMKAAIGGLEPDTTYDWILVSANGYTISPALNEGETAVQRQFTTAAAPAGSTEPSVSFSSVINGYSMSKATVSVPGLNGQKVLKIGLEREGGSQTYSNALETEKVTDTEHVLPGWDSSWDTLSYYDWAEEGNSFNVSLETDTTITPFVQAEVWTADGYQVKTFKGTSQAAAKRDSAVLTVQEEATEYMTESYVSRSVKLAPVELERDIQVGFYYKKTTDTDWAESSNVWNTVLEDGVLGLWFNISDLEAETEYQLQYRVYAYDDYSKSNVLCTLNGGTFTTPAVLTQEDIPDPVLWRNLTGGESSISITELEEKTDLYVSSYYGAVKDLTGIGYLKNLTSIDLQQHAISDVTPLLECEKLEEINLSRNELTSMPDFSGLSSLTKLTLDYNMIPEEEVTEDKYPAGASVSVKYQRKEPLTFSLSDNHIYKEAADSETYGVQIQLDNVKSYQSSLKLKITDKTDKDNEVILYELSSIPFKQTSSNSIYSISAVVTGIQAEAGERIWEFTYEVCNQTLTSEVAVTVDPDGVGGIQVMPESILPSAIKSFLLRNYSSYDKNGDSEFSFAEIADIPSLTMFASSLAATDFKFLQYMKGLEILRLNQQTGLTQSQLSYLTGLTELTELNLSGTSITDLTPLASLTKLKTLNLSGISSLTGLEALKGLTELTWIGTDSGVFSEEEIFDFICSTAEKTLAVGEKKKLVSSALYLSDVSEITVTCSEEGILGFAEGELFEAYGMREGRTNVTYTYGEISRTMPVTVTAAEWDYDPELGPVVEDADRMHFTGTEGLLNARASRSMEMETSGVFPRVHLKSF